MKYLIFIGLILALGTVDLWSQAIGVALASIPAIQNGVGLCRTKAV